MEPALDLVHPRGDLAGRAAQGRGAGSLGGRKTASGVAEQRLARLGIGTAIGGEKGLRLARGEQVALGGARQAELFPLGEGREQGGEREREMASIDPRGQIFRQTTAQSQASLDPGRLSPQQLRDRRDRQAVVLRERSHDAGLVHGAGGLPGTVRFQEARLDRGPFYRLDDHRNFALLPPPPGQAFEAIEDFEAAVLPSSDPQRQRGQLALLRMLPAQGRERRSESFHRDPFNERHGDPRRGVTGTEDTCRRSGPCGRVHSGPR